MAHQRAGEEGKPGIHISSTDAKRAQRMGLEEDSPSTVYTDALEAYEKYKILKKREIKKAKSNIVKELDRMEEDFDVERNDILETIVDGEIV